MMYHKKLVAAIKVNGKILRESGDEVALPFGSEYTILLKNLNSVRAMVKVSIDGQDVTGDRWLVIDANGQMELERFIRNGNLQSGNKLKFIERTEQVEAGRGIKAEDGLVRVEWKTEKVFDQPKITYTHQYYYCHSFLPSHDFQKIGSNDNTFSHSGSISGLSHGGLRSANCSVNSASLMSAPDITEASAGITVPGGQSSQQFQQVGWFETENQSEVLVLHLKGRQGNVKVAKPVTVKTKKICSTCSKTNKSTDHFCGVCGTSLNLI